MNVSCNGFLGSKCTCPSCPSRLIPDCGPLGVQKVCTSYVWGRTLTSTAIDSRPTQRVETIHVTRTRGHANSTQSMASIKDFGLATKLRQEQIIHFSSHTDTRTRVQGRTETRGAGHHPESWPSHFCWLLLLLCECVLYSITAKCCHQTGLSSASLHRDKKFGLIVFGAAAAQRRPEAHWVRL